MKNIFLASVLLWLSLLFFMPGQIMASDNSRQLTVSGSAPLLAEESVSRIEAGKSAGRSAVESVLRDYVNDDDLKSNYDIIKTKILDNFQVYLLETGIISQDKDAQAGRYIVRQSVSVNVVKLVADLKKLGLVPGWTVLVLADQYQEITPQSYNNQSGPADIQIQLNNGPAGQNLPVYYERPCLSAEIALIKKFQAAGYKVIDARSLATERRKNLAIKMAQGDNTGVLTLAQQMGADVVVYASALAEVTYRSGDAPGRESEQMNFRIISARANIYSKAVRVDSAEVLAADSFQGNGADLTENLAGEKAISLAAEQAGSYLTQKIDLWPRSSSIKIQMGISGLSAGQVNEVLKIIRQMDSVISVNLGGVSGGQASVQMVIRGSAARLADNIENSMEIKKFNLKLTILSSSSLLLKSR